MFKASFHVSTWNSVYIIVCFDYNIFLHDYAQLIGTVTMVYRHINVCIECKAPTRLRHMNQAYNMA